jgi:hypothetical protein
VVSRSGYTDTELGMLSVGIRNGRCELIAACRFAGRDHDIALLDVDVDANQPASRLVAAYRHWPGA